MADPIKVSGRCLCGAVAVAVQQVDPSVSSCHCRMCRRWGGGPLHALDCGADVAFTGVDHIATFDSSEWAERGFCRDCGTHLFYRIKASGQYILPVGLLDDEPSWQLQAQIFVDEKPAYYNFAESTKMMTGAEVFAMYAPPEIDDNGAG
ncbi:GFA family protein [Motiliproteus sp.]|uniref:GFA family protein n=1 Tax=Motiliproteus sp. TaxID=1898955 RepID=UPI003BA9CC19